MVYGLEDEDGAGRRRRARQQEKKGYSSPKFNNAPNMSLVTTSLENMRASSLLRRQQRRLCNLARVLPPPSLVKITLQWRMFLGR